MNPCIDGVCSAFRLQDKARMIIQYLATRFRDAFSEIKYVPVFRQILKLDDDFTGTPANPLPANGEAGTSSKTPGVGPFFFFLLS